MNITIFGLYSNFSPHFEVELELAELHLEKGDQVTFITCDSVLKCCEPNIEHAYSICLHCMGKAKMGLGMLGDKVRVIPLSQLLLPVRDELGIIQEICRQPLTYDLLYKTKIDNFDIGAAALSSMNDYFKDTRPDPMDHLEKIRDMLASALAIYKGLLLYLQEQPCDQLYVFNGRFTNMRAALRACERMNVPCLVHERGGDKYRYALSLNAMPHDPKFTVPYMTSICDAASVEEKKEVAHQFYTELETGVPTNFVSYILKQRKGLTVQDWETASPRIAVFTSTESEFASLTDLIPPSLYPFQRVGLLRIMEDLARNNFQGIFAIRIHPNSYGSTSDYTEEFRKLGYPFLKVISPKDPVDTYGLMRTSDKVLTFGSTIGIEAAYWRKPSILAGWSFYAHLDSTYYPTTHEQLMDYLLLPLEPKPIQGAIDYGFAARTSGTKFRFVAPKDLWYCTFKGVDLGFSSDLYDVWNAVTDGPHHEDLTLAMSKREAKRLEYLYERSHATPCHS